MDPVRLGASGLHVSRVCLGMMSYGNDSDRPWVLDEAAAEPIVRMAVEGGVTFFDTADVYSGGASEVATGRLLRRFVSRDEVVVATKVHGQTTPGPNGRGLSRKHILSAIDASLGRLEMDHVDLYQIHRWDKATPIEETMEALHDVVRAGKARYIGASSMYAWQFARAQHVAEKHGWTKFVSMQDQYSLIQREEEREMFGLLADQGVGSLPWSPLAGGVVARPWGDKSTNRGKDNVDVDSNGNPLWFDSDKQIVDTIQRVAETRGVSMAQVAMAWVLKNPVVDAPIVGATRQHHLTDAVAALDLQLTDDEVTALKEPYVLRQGTWF